MLHEFWILTSALLVLIGLLTSQGMLLVVGSLVIVVATVARFWDKGAFRRVAHRRALSAQKAFIGDSLDYTVTLTNDKLLPLIWVELQDNFPGELGLPGANLRGVGGDTRLRHRITTSLLPYQRVSWQYQLKCRARGFHRIGPAQLRSGDIFGFSAAETTFDQVDHVLIYPRVVDLGQLFYPAENPLGDAKGRRPLHEDLSRFMGLRDYRPADPLKRVDWKATARRSALQIKVFEPVISLNLLVALNSATAEFAWQGANRRLFERAVTAAASVASYAAQQRLNFGLVSNAVAAYSGKWISAPLSGDPGQLLHTLEALALAGPYSVLTLAEALRAERRSMPYGTTIVVVTAVLSGDLLAEVGELRLRGHQLLVMHVGDARPRVDAAGIPIYSIGQNLERWDADEPVLA